MFKVQVRVKVYNAGAWIHVYRDLHPTNGPAYQFESVDAARRAIALTNDGSRTREDFRVIHIADNREV